MPVAAIRPVNDVRFDPQRAAHLCIDMQRLFSDEGPWRTPWLKRVLPRVCALVSAHAAATIFTRFVPPPSTDAATGSWKRVYQAWPQLILDRLDLRLIELVEPLAAYAPPAAVIDKHTYSPFLYSGLLSLLKKRQISTLIVSGAETDLCVLATVLHAVDLGYFVVIARDAVCSGNDATHDALFTLYEQRFSHQVRVCTVEEILDRWQ